MAHVDDLCVRVESGQLLVDLTELLAEGQSARIVLEFRWWRVETGNGEEERAQVSLDSVHGEIRLEGVV